MKIAVPIVLTVMVLVGFFLRFWQVGSIPSGLNRDEAALAYNGLLLKESGKDEWQRSWPLNLESFGDFKLIGYPAILSVLFRFLPINDTVVRLPSVIAGSLLPLALYFLARRLAISTFSALIISILALMTPVFFFYSRMAFEANVALTLLVFGIAVMLKNKYRIVDIGLALILCTASIFTYNTPLLLLPFIVLLVPFIQGLSKVRRWLLPVALLLIVWVIAFVSLSQTFSQKSGITLFNDSSIVLEVYPQYREQFSGFTQTVIGNKYVFYLLRISSNIVATFSPLFLVTEGGAHPWHSLLGWAHLNWLVVVLLYAGLVKLIVLAVNSLLRKRLQIHAVKLLSKESWLKFAKTRQALILYLLVAATIPAAITVDAPHATRSLFFFVMVFLIVGITIDSVLSHLSQKLRLLTQHILLGLLLYAGVYFGLYLIAYFSEYPLLSEKLFQSNFIEAVQAAERQYPDQIIAVVDQGGYQYIILSWYKKLASEEFFSTVVRQNQNSIGFRYGERVSHFHFIDKPSDRLTGEKAYIIWSGDEYQWQVKE